MRRCIKISMPMVLSLGVASVGLAQAEKTDSVPEQAAMRTSAWAPPTAYTTDNGVRGEMLLNGFWLRMPVKDGEAASVRVRVPDWEIPSGRFLLYRDVEIPSRWHGRQLWLQGLGQDTAVSFDHKPAKYVAGRGFDLGSSGSGWRRLQAEAGHIASDCWIVAEPARPAIGDTYLRTLFRNGQRVSLQASGHIAAGTSARLVVQIYDQPGDKVIKTFGAPVTGGANGTWSGEPAASWELELWTRWHPKLYWYSASLIGPEGEVIDATLPQRFGFREVWVEKGRLVINGIPTTGCSETQLVWDAAALQKNGNSNHLQTRAQMLMFKQMGLSAISPAAPALLDLADEEGMLVAGDIGSLVRDVNVWDPNSGLTRMTGTQSEDDIREKTRSYRQHPSVLFASSANVYSLAMMHPEYMGRAYPTWEHYPLNRNSQHSRAAYETLERVQQLVRESDPDRIVSSVDGPSGQINTGTCYLCDNLDIQEREEYLDYWHRTDRQKAMWISEFGIPFPGHLFLRAIDHQMPHTGLWPPIYLENAARWYGDSVYQAEDDAALRAMSTFGQSGVMARPITQRMYAENATRYFRAWRTYGAQLNGHVLLATHGILGNPNVTLPVDETSGFVAADPRIPGYSRPAPLSALGHTDLIAWSQAGLAHIRAMAPLMAYIGGPDGRFAGKDHLFYAGAPVRKNVILVNDYDQAISVQARWSLEDAAGTVILRGQGAATVQPGERDLKNLAIEFAAPDVSERTDFTLKMACSADRNGTLDDEFKITVFPKHIPQQHKFAGQVWRLNISDDYTHESQHFFINRDNEAFLKSAGIASRLVKGLKEFKWEGYDPNAADAAQDPKRRPLVTEGDPRPGDLLIIPRQTLKSGVDDRQTCLRLLQAMDLDRLVEQGLNVLVMEQDLPNVFGMVTEDTRPRRVFSAAAGHPVLAGLSGEDFWNWTGDSDLQDAITPYSSSQRQFPDRMAHTSNLNAVASRTFVRPQLGACRALLVSGFDLQESPLLETVRGKGRMIFCSLDLTNRYGKDPAATRLVDNLFAYLATAPQPDPTKAAVVEVQANEPAVVKSDALRLAIPDGTLGWGMTHGDLFLREGLFQKDNDRLAGRALPVFADAGKSGALPSVVRVSAGVVQTTLSPEALLTGWNQRKAAWVRAALTINAGGSTTEGPALRYHGQSLPLYPRVWVEQFVHPYTANIW